MENVEMLRDFEKSAKALTKLRGTELMFEDDAIGRQRFVYLAMDGKEEELRAVVQEIAQMPEGARHIARALNNLVSIGHAGSHLFAKLCFEVLLPEWPIDVELTKCLYLLSIVSPEFSGELGFLQDHSLVLLRGLKAKTADYLRLWQALCGCILRSNGDTDALIRLLGPMRQIQMTRRQFDEIKSTLSDQKVSWEIRASNAYFLLGNMVINLEEAMRFLDAAYTSFPLEALVGIEALSIAIEMDASELVESELINDKLAQVRRDGMILRELEQDAFERASAKVFAKQSQWPVEALEIVKGLDTLERSERMLMTTLIDDTRRNDYFEMTRKYACLKLVSKDFFSHFEPTNPFSLAYSQDFVTQLIDNANAPAREAEAWFEAIESNDIERLCELAKFWAAGVW